MSKIENAHITDLIPKTAASDTPVIFAPGWGGTPGMYIDQLKALCEGGRRTLAVHAPHGLFRNIVDRGMLTGRFPNAELRKVEALLYTLNKKNVVTADIVAHSEGGLYSVLATVLFPRRFRNLVLANPAGLIGKDNFLRLAKDFLTDAYNNSSLMLDNKKAQERLERAKRTIRKSVLQNPLRALAQALAIAGSNNQWYIQRLRRHGHKIAVIHMYDDIVFPFTRMRNTLMRFPVDEFLHFNGGHAEFYLYPETYMPQVLDILSRFEQVEQQKNTSS